MNELKQLNNLPIHELIGNPLRASIKAQQDVSLSMINYIKEIGIDGNKARTLDFNISRPVVNGNTMEVKTIPVSAPLLGLVPLPSLLIETLSIEFTAAITDYVERSKGTGPKPLEQQKESGEQSETPLQESEKPSIEMYGRVISYSENMRKTNSSATYTIKIEAKQQEPTEGWSKIIDMLASASEPLNIEGT